MRESGLHLLYIVANSLQCVRSSGDTDKGHQSRATTTEPGPDENATEKTEVNIGIGRPSLVSFTKTELESVRTIAHSEGTEGCLGLLVASFCPTIFGHELVKLGLLLGMVILLF